MFQKALSILLLISLLLSAACARGEEVTIPNISTIYRQEVPDNEAMAFVKDMKIGWNLGNTFDATGGSQANVYSQEQSWGNPKVDAALIKRVKDAGFKTIRIPVTWYRQLSKDGQFTINPAFMARIKEVVDMARDEGLFVILNMHHEEWLNCKDLDTKYEQIGVQLAAIWRQIADTFADYDQHLIFEGMNEPRPKGKGQEWWFNQDDPYCQEVAGCINKLNQAFVDTVRASGGRNADRYLMVTPYCATPEAATNLNWFKLPQDAADNRLIVSVHAYRPYDFALEMPGVDSYDPVKNAGQLSEIVSFMSSLYKTYVANGIPVVLGEYGAIEKNGNLQDRATFYAYYVATASSRNIPCVVWDNHAFKGNGERFGLLDRKKLTWPDQILVDAMMKYAGYETLPAKK